MKVTNISGSTQLIYDKGGKPIKLKNGESAEMISPPAESWVFKVTMTEEKEAESLEKAEEKTIERRKK